MEMEKKGCDEIEHELIFGEQKVNHVKDCITDIETSIAILEQDLNGKINDYNTISNKVQEVMKTKKDNEKMEKDLMNKKRDLERKIRHNGKMNFV